MKNQIPRAMRTVHLCNFESAGHLRGKARTYEAIKAAVLAAGKFSCFEASESPGLFTRLCQDPEVETLKEDHGFHYPWTGIRLRKP